LRLPILVSWRRIALPDSTVASSLVRVLRMLSHALYGVASTPLGTCRKQFCGAQEAKRQWMPARVKIQIANESLSKIWGSSYRNCRSPSNLVASCAVAPPLLSMYASRCHGQAKVRAQLTLHQLLCTNSFPPTRVGAIEFAAAVFDGHPWSTLCRQVCNCWTR